MNDRQMSRKNKPGRGPLREELNLGQRGRKQGLASESWEGQN